MRVLAVILIFYASCCIAEHEKRILRKIPKKVSSGFVKYLNYNRFLPESTTKTNINKNYTVFQAVLPNERKVNIPDSPYFPVEVNVDHKIRVKKVLPAYIPRKKRSADNKEVTKDFKDVKETNIRNSDKTKHKHKERQAIKNKKHKKSKSKKSKNKKSNKKHKKSANKSPKDTRRLITGKDALIEEYPYKVSIQKDNQHWCSGAKGKELAGCGTERFPAMFSYLASHSNMDFITNATRNLMADHRYYPFLDRYPQISQ